MSKFKLSPQALIYPNPAVIVGSNVDGRANFMTAAWCGVACSDPPAVAVAIRPSRYTYKGIKQNSTFAINIASVDLVHETDYCGIRPGSEVDKARICGFRVFYGKTASAPLIEQCPVNLECSVIHLIELGSHVLVVGRVEDTYVSEDCLTDGKPDADKIRPFAFIAGQYRAMGETVGKAFGAGLEIKSREAGGLP
jgi:flavin reductase (DIM6/NTAB) family NADH-FMN oxidoreductase RutF